MLADMLSNKSVASRSGSRGSNVTEQAVQACQGEAMFRLTALFCCTSTAQNVILRHVYIYVNNFTELRRIAEMLTQAFD